MFLRALPLQEHRQNVEHTLLTEYTGVLSMQMTADEVREFIRGNTLEALEPDSRALVATVSYLEDGTVAARFADGSSDTGQFGFSGHYYWTCYRNFRQGSRNEFSLFRLDENEAQAFHRNGTRAFVQRLVHS